MCSMTNKHSFRTETIPEIAEAAETHVQQRPKDAKVRKSYRISVNPGYMDLGVSYLGDRLVKPIIGGGGCFDLAKRGSFFPIFLGKMVFYIS